MLQLYAHVSDHPDREAAAALQERFGGLFLPGSSRECGHARCRLGQDDSRCEKDATHPRFERVAPACWTVWRFSFERQCAAHKLGGLLDASRNPEDGRWGLLPMTVSPSIMATGPFFRRRVAAVVDVSPGERSVSPSGLWCVFRLHCVGGRRRRGRIREGKDPGLAALEGTDHRSVSCYDIGSIRVQSTEADRHRWTHNGQRTPT